MDNGFDLTIHEHVNRAQFPVRCSGCVQHGVASLPSLGLADVEWLTEGMRVLTRWGVSADPNSLIPVTTPYP